jgi:hypothetical protein
LRTIQGGADERHARRPRKRLWGSASAPAITAPVGGGVFERRDTRQRDDRAVDDARELARPRVRRDETAQRPARARSNDGLG